jgi:carbon-monoxide dehydrogenase large subunit
VVVTIGSASTGQSHETTFAQIAADVLGVDPDGVVVRHSDTEQSPYGQGTYGSRSFSVGGPAVHRAAVQVLEKMRKAAAHFLGAGPAELGYLDGVFSTPAGRSKTFADVAMALWYGWDLPVGMEPSIDVTAFFDPPDFNYPYGSHIAVVEIDERTGEVEIVDYVAVNDAGNIGNPLVVDRQVQGSIVHGIGQALLEEARYADDGRLLTDDLRSYALPRAQDVPPMVLDWTCSPSPHNELGVKGAGEIATVPPTAAISNAVCNALAEFGVTHIDMPMTQEKIWRELQSRRGAVQ